MRRLQLLVLASALLAAMACRDATAPQTATVLGIRGPQRALAIPSPTPQVAAGDHFTCALRTDGTVVCWGAIVPPPTDLASAVQLTAFAQHACALKADGTIVCWGNDPSGASDVPVGLTSVAQVSTGGVHSCALKTDGTVACWGDNTYGETAVPVGLVEVAEVRVGNFFSCARKTDGTVVCWGYTNGESTPPLGLSSVVQISTGGDSACALKADGTIVCWGDVSDPSVSAIMTGAAALTTVAQLSSNGDSPTCAIEIDRTLVCWGPNTFGQTSVPSGLTLVAQVSGSGAHTCALKMDGTVVCWAGWNSNYFGEATVPNGLNLGAQGPPGTPPPPLVIPATTAQLSAGAASTCVLKTDGTVVCWGGNYDQSTVPSGLASVAQVSTGLDAYAPCALKTNGTVVCWGHNDANDVIVPPGLNSVVQIKAGQSPCALKADRSLVCWGATSDGAAPVPYGLQSVVQVSAGGYHTCALKTDGSVVCWGGAEVGYDFGQATVPVGLNAVKEVSAGGYHTCALKTDGTVVCWGAVGNDAGQTTVPADLGAVTQVSAGGLHTCALKTDRTVVCWGFNNFGAATVPPGLTSVAQVSAGFWHSCALKTDGTVVCWGYNAFGQTSVPAGLTLDVAVTQAISFTSAAPNPAYVGGTYSVTAAATSGLPIAFSTTTSGMCSVSGGTVTFVAVGTCIVVADQTGDAAHLAAPEQTQSILVAKQSQSIGFTSSAPSPAYVGATYSVAASSTSGLPVALSTSTPSTCSVNGGTVIFVALGTCTLAVDQAGDATYLPAPEQTQSIVIVKRPQTITFTSTEPNQPLVGATYAVAATASSGLAVSLTSLTPTTCTVAGNKADFVAAGACTLAADQAGNAVYLAAPEQTQSITVITPAQAIQNLLATIAGMGLPNGVATSLSATLKNLDTANLSSACGKLNAFVNQVNAKSQSGQLTASAAGQLLIAAKAITASLGCT